MGKHIPGQGRNSGGKGLEECMGDEGTESNQAGLGALHSVQERKWKEIRLGTSIETDRGRTGKRQAKVSGPGDLGIRIWTPS